jgi:hypothetical protein
VLAFMNWLPSFAWWYLSISDVMLAEIDTHHYLSEHKRYSSVVSNGCYFVSKGKIRELF